MQTLLLSDTTNAGPYERCRVGRHSYGESPLARERGQTHSQSRMRVLRPNLT